MSEPVLLEVRERCSRFGRIARWSFWVFQGAMLVLNLGTCAAVTPYLAGPDPEVAMGAGMFGAMALGTLWMLWPAGTVVLGLLMLLTRGRKRLIPAPSAEPPPQSPLGVPGPGTPAAVAAAAPPREVPRRAGGSVPTTGGGGDSRPATPETVPGAAPRQDTPERGA